MTENTIKIVKKVSHVILVCLSMLLSVNLFFQFSDTLIIQILFGLMAISLELIKLYLLIEAKYHFKMEETKNKVLAGIEFIIYSGLAFISIVASLGFTTVSIEEQSLRFETKKEVSNFEIDQLINELEINNKQISIIQQNASELEFSAVERNEQANSQVETIQNKNREIVQKIDQLRALKETDIKDEVQFTGAQMFILLGQFINKSGQDTMFAMMVILVILLEIAIAITSASIEQKLKLSLAPDMDIFKYIEALFDTETKRLANDLKISKMLSISQEKCLEYRQILSKITYKGRPLIEMKRGGTMTQFSKDSVIKIVKFNINSGKNLFLN